MISTNSLLLSRRSLLQGSAATLAGLSISSLALSDTAIAEKPSIIPEMADASNSEFRIPTKELPIRVQYNENPLGMSLKAQKAAAQAIPLANRYPFSEIPILRKLVANYHNVNDDCILLVQVLPMLFEFVLLRMQHQIHNLLYPNSLMVTENFLLKPMV